MKRFTKILLPISTFALGCLAFYALNIPFSFQTVVKYKDFFEGRVVRIETHLFKFNGKYADDVDDSWYVAEADCSTDLECGANLDFSNYKGDFDFHKLNDKFTQLNDDAEDSIFPNAKIVVYGKVKYKPMHCYTMPFRIEVESIEQIAPAENFVLRER